MLPWKLIKRHGDALDTSLPVQKTIQMWSGWEHEHGLPWLEPSEEPAGLVGSAGGGEGSDRCVQEEAQASCDQGDHQGAHPGVPDGPGDLGDLGVAACP